MEDLIEAVNRVAHRSEVSGFDAAKGDVVLWAKYIRSELEEVLAAVESGDWAHVQEEVGDLQCNVLRLARCLGVDAVAGAHRSAEKVLGRFDYIDANLPTHLSGSDRDARVRELWVEAKSWEIRK